MSNDVNPYRPSGIYSEKHTAIWCLNLPALFAAAAAATLYVIGDFIAFASKAGEWNSDMLVVSFLPLIISMPCYLLCKSISVLQVYASWIYLSICLILVLVAAFAESVYPVFFGMRRDVVGPMLAGVILSVTVLFSFDVIRRIWRKKSTVRVKLEN